MAATEDTAGPDPLAVAAEAGRRVLEAGGETYRAEDTVVRLCALWGFPDGECFATPTGIMASVGGGDGLSRAVVRRVARRAVDLHRIGRLTESVARAEVSGQDPAAFKAAIDILDKERPYPLAVNLAAAGAGAAFFTLFFQGSVRDAAAAFLVGVGIKVAVVLLSSRSLPDFIVNIIGGAIAAGLSSLAVSAGLAENLDKTVIGAIMLLVPGLATVNAIRDTIAGDLVAGIARLSDAVMAAAALAIGAATVFSAAGTLGNFVP